MFTSQFASIFAVSATFFHMGRAVSDHPPTSAGVPQSLFYDADDLWAEESHHLALLQRRALYKVSNEALFQGHVHSPSVVHPMDKRSALRDHSTGPRQSQDHHASVPSGFDAVFKRTDSILDGSPTLTLLQTNATVVDAELPENFTDNHTSQLEVAGLGYGASPAPQATATETPLLKNHSTRLGEETRTKQMERVSRTEPFETHALPAEDSSAEATATPAPNEFQNESSETPIRIQHAPQVHVPNKYVDLSALLEKKTAVTLAPTNATMPHVLIMVALIAWFLVALVAGIFCLVLYCSSVRSSNAHLSGTSTSSAHALVAGMPIAHSRHVDKYLPKSFGYDCALSRPVSSGRALRFQVRVEGPLCGIPLTSPLSQKPCVLYSASVSQPSHAGVNPMSVAYAADSQPFTVSLLDAPDVRLEIRGEDVSLFAMSEGLLNQSASFNSVPNHWQAFALSRRLSASHHSPPASRLYNEDPILEFEECALHVGSQLTCVGELSRREDGVLSLQPWLPHLGQVEPPCDTSKEVSKDTFSALSGSTYSGKILASDTATLLRISQERGLFAKLSIIWGSSSARSEVGRQ